MTNDYYNATATISRQALARSAAENSDRAAVAAGFDLLPSKSSLYNDMLGYAADSGAANSYVVAMPKTITAYTTGMRVRMLVGTTNTGASTINVDSVGERYIKRIDGTDPEAGDLTAGDLVEFSYDGTYFIQLGFYRSHMAGIASSLGSDLTFTGNNSFTGTNTFDDDGFTLRDNVDDTKKAQFQLSGISAGATRIFTLPDVNDTLVALAATQTLTNKTLTSPSIAAGALSGTFTGAPTFSGNVAFTGTPTFSGIDINGGAIDGTPIGASSASTGSFTTLATSDDVTITNASSHADLFMIANSANRSRLWFGDEVSAIVGAFQYDHVNDSLIAYVNISEAYRVDSSRNFLVGKGAIGSGIAGFQAASTGVTAVTADNTIPFVVNRLTSDGTQISLQQDGTQEGSISVSGTTVSYNGAHLSRWAQVAETSILRGTVMTNLDEMCVWRHVSYIVPTLVDPAHEYVPAVAAQDAVMNKDGSVKTPAVAARAEIPAKAAVYQDIEHRVEYFGAEPDGAVIEVTHEGIAYQGTVYTEDNEQLNRMAVSSVAGDRNVAGVFQGWDESDAHGDIYCAMTGDFVIRIAAGVTVQRGELMESAGDGTARAQVDDVVRSSTVAKITSTHVTETYADGSYIVPCVLMAC